MANRKHLLHVKSNVVEKAEQYGIKDFLVTPKKPVDPSTGKATNDTLLHGEIAVNYGKGVEALIIRNTEDNVVTFVNENDFYEANEIIADGIATEKLERENAFVNLEGKIDASVISKMVSITYAEIKALRDQSKLKPGQFYRITDYVTTTKQENTRSAGHVFDVIVLATDVDTLNENAKAIKHEGDTYFANSHLDAWEIKYDLDNDITKYAWADETNGKGVIFYMKDEWNNECPYDFKNIQFKRWAITNITSNSLSTVTLQVLNKAFNFNNNGSKHFANKDMGGNWLPNSQGLTVTVDESKFGWYYTFNGMSSKDGITISNTYDLSTNQFKLSDECLNWIEKNSSAGSDSTDRCYDNKISLSTDEYFVNNAYNKGRIVLNNIVFNNGLSYCYSDGEDWVYKTCSCYRNTFGNNCYNNTFGNNCNANTFGNDCGNNTFGNKCYSNTFGNNCYNNTFGNNCNANTFGNKCYSNTFGNDCGNNTFGDGCHSNTFGNYCYYNTFGNNCYNNTFGNYCDNNTFGNNCYNNIFGNGCDNNTFGNYCDNNTFGNSCYYNTFGNECPSNTFGNSCYYNTFGSNVQYIIFNKDYMFYNIVENGNKYITVTSSHATTSSNQVLRNFTIAQGVNNDAVSESQRKKISHDTVNDTFKTTYQNANSKTANVK